MTSKADVFSDFQVSFSKEFAHLYEANNTFIILKVSQNYIITHAVYNIANTY